MKVSGCSPHLYQRPKTYSEVQQELAEMHVPFKRKPYMWKPAPCDTPSYVQLQETLHRAKERAASTEPRPRFNPVSISHIYTPPRPRSWCENQLNQLGVPFKRSPYMGTPAVKHTPIYPDLLRITEEELAKAKAKEARRVNAMETAAETSARQCMEDSAGDTGESWLPAIEEAVTDAGAQDDFEARKYAEAALKKIIAEAAEAKAAEVAALEEAAAAALAEAAAEEEAVKKAEEEEAARKAVEDDAARKAAEEEAARKAAEEEAARKAAEEEAARKAAAGEEVAAAEEMATAEAAAAQEVAVEAEVAMAEEGALEQEAAAEAVSEEAATEA